MENVIISQITQNVNITIVVLLLIIGAVFKHWITMVENKYIPVILCVLGVVFTFIFHLPIAVDTTFGAVVIAYIVEGIATGIAATIVHSKGKDIIADLFNKETFADTVEDGVDKYVQEQLEKLGEIDFSKLDNNIKMEEQTEDKQEEELVDLTEAINKEE